MERLTAPAELEVERNRFADARWASAPFEGRIGASYNVERFAETASFPRGTIVVPLHQRAAKVAIHLLEPEGPDAFAAWGFFNAVFEQREYAEDYVIEPLAKDMLEKDATLKRESGWRIIQDFAAAASSIPT